MNLHPIGLDRELTDAGPEQRRVHDMIANGKRGWVPSPFLAMLDAPELAAAIQEVGVGIRFGGKLSDDRRELAILATAGAIGCDYEWAQHVPIAQQSGVSDSTIAATRSIELLSDVGHDHATIIRFCQEVARTRRANADILAAALSLFGRAETTELIAIAGYYGLLASFIFIGGHDR